MTAIASIGHLSLDSVDGAPPRPGGTVFYAARALSRLGADARVAAACAPDDRPQLLPALEVFDLTVTWRESSTTTAFRIRYARDGRRAMQLEAVGDPWPAKEAVSAVGDAAWVHVGGLVRTDFGPATLSALAAGGRTLLADAQGLVRLPVLGPLRSDGEIGDLLQHAAILKLDDEEAETLVGSTDPDRLRSLGVPELILTLGAKGSIVVTPDRTDRVAAVEVVGAVDPTGAGDTYGAAYLAARATGAEPAEAARSATELVAELLAEVG